MIVNIFDMEQINSFSVLRIYTSTNMQIHICIQDNEGIK